MDGKEVCGLLKGITADQLKNGAKFSDLCKAAEVDEKKIVLISSVGSLKDGHPARTSFARRMENNR